VILGLKAVHSPPAASFTDELASPSVCRKSRDRYA
jgi:hypothetical protein